MDNNGYVLLIDSLIAIFLLILIVLFFTQILTFPLNSYSVESSKSITSQDVMSSLSTKINYTDITFLEEITSILKENNNSKKSIKLVSKMVKNKLNLNQNYVFKETSVLNKDLVSVSDYKQADNYTIASRNCGNYTYVLILYN